MNNYCSKCIKNKYNNQNFNKNNFRERFFLLNFATVLPVFANNLLIYYAK